MLVKVTQVRSNLHLFSWDKGLPRQETILSRQKSLGHQADYERQLGEFRGWGRHLLTVFLAHARSFPVEAFTAHVHFPSPGIGPIHLNEIQCTGNEKSIIDCKFNAESQGCNHEEDAGVRCNIPAMGFQKKVRRQDSQRGQCYVLITEASASIAQVASG